MRNLILTILLALTICSTAYAGYKVTGNLEVTGNAGVGTSSPTTELQVVGVVTATGGTSTSWNTAYTDRLKWDGGATGLTAATGRASLELGSIYALNAGTMTDTKYCTYSTAGTAIVCNSEGGSGSGTPGGSDTQLQFNNDGAFGGIDGTIYSGTTISYSGNIAIGTTEATQKLEVLGGVKATTFTGNLTGAVTGNASTASALAADPANCASSGLAGGINASGVAEACVTPNAGTNIANDLEEEVTEGSLADSTIISADIKDGTIASADIGTLTTLNATGNVGIGTTETTALLTVKGNASLSNTLTVAGNVGIGTTDVTRPLTVKGAGNVGINSTAPRQQLEVVGSIQATGFIANGNVGISTTAPTTCGCKQYTNGLCTTVGTCS